MIKDKEPCYFDVFLVSAYQEVLSDLRNLCGDTNAAHVSVDNKGYHIDQIINGETDPVVIDYLQYMV